MGLRPFAGSLVKIVVIADELGLQLIHMFFAPGDDIAVFGLGEEDAAGMLVEVVCLDHGPVGKTWVRAVEFDDTIVVGGEEGNAGLLDGCLLGNNPLVEVLGDGRDGMFGDEFVGSADVVATGLQEGVNVI